MTVSNRLGDSVGGELVQVKAQGFHPRSNWSNVDTKSQPWFERRYMFQTFPNHPFLVSMLDFGGVRVLKILCCRTLPNLMQRKTILISLNITW